jgi:hypothetical protein
MCKSSEDKSHRRLTTSERASDCESAREREQEDDTPLAVLMRTTSTTVRSGNVRVTSKHRIRVKERCPINLYEVKRHLSDHLLRFNTKPGSTAVTHSLTSFQYREMNIYHVDEGHHEY